MPPKCPSAHCCAATQGHKCPLPLASCHTARPGANTLPFPSCCLTARLETQAQSNFVPTWTHPNKENSSLPRRGAVVLHQGLVTTPISLQSAPTNHIPSAVTMPLPIMKSDSNKLQTQSAHTQTNNSSKRRASPLCELLPSPQPAPPLTPQQMRLFPEATLA